MTQINGFKGFVGFNIRELNSNETQLYCSNNSMQAFPSIKEKNNFTSDFIIRTYTSGCYYFDLSTGKWSTGGMDIYYDTNIKKTHCSSYHLTSFAGGLVVLTTAINFQYHFVNDYITKNPTIYTTVIVLVCLYFIFTIWAKIMDKKDSKKMGIYWLNDNNPNDTYIYELIVFTGNRNESQTKSKVVIYVRFY